MRSIRLTVACVGIWTAILSGCQGYVTTSAQPSLDGDANPSPDAGTVQPPRESYLPARVRLLNRNQYNNSIAALMGDGSRPADVFPVEAPQSGFTNNAGQDVGARLASNMFSASETLAVNLVKHLPEVLGCDWKRRSEQICARRFIDTFAKKAYRRPLTVDDRRDLMEVFRAARDGTDFETGIQFVIETVLNSASFLYITELGDPAQATATAQIPIALTAHEVASALSYLVLDAPPDDQLAAAADGDALGDGTALGAELGRLLSAALSHLQVRRFYFEWLGVSKLPETLKDTNFTNFTALAPSMAAETAAFVDDLVFAGDGSLRTLIGGRYTFVDQAMADFYRLGLTVTPDTWQRASLAGTSRGGVLTQASFLSVQSGISISSPVKRGVFVLRRLLCEELPDPPAGVAAVPPVLPATVSTTRELFEAHTSAPQCAGCHAVIDPVGYAFEHFDAIGAYRTDEGGHAIDSAGRLTGTDDADGTFDDTMGLIDLLAQSHEVRTCFQRHFLRFASAQADPGVEQKFLTAISQRSPDDFIGLLRAYVTSDVFRLRESR